MAKQRKPDDSYQSRDILLRKKKQKQMTFGIGEV